MKILRTDQVKLKGGIYDDWQGGSKVVCAVSPTGTGKSVVMTSIVDDIQRLGVGQAQIAHRRELVDQLAGHLASAGIYHRLIAPDDVIRDIIKSQREEYGRSYYNPDAPTSVVAIDTLVARRNDEAVVKWANTIQYWHGDEGHHYLRENKWGKGIDLFPATARGLLVTACPLRADSKGLGAHAAGYATSMVLGPTFREAIELGGITDYEIAVPASDFEIDEDRVGKDGDFTSATMRDASRKSKIVGSVVEEYIKRAYGKRAILFATDNDTSARMAEKFMERGIPAVSLSAKTPANVRREMIKRFKLGQIMVLINVDLFDEGFDVPACEVVIMARPTASLNKYLQMIGRGLRRAEGKLYGLIIDHVSNYKRHGLPDKRRVWSLDNVEKGVRKAPDPEEVPMTACTECSRPYERAETECPHCGHEPEVEAAATGGRALIEVDGDLTLLDRATLAEMRAAMEIEDPEKVANRVALAAGEFAGRGAANKQREKIAAQQRLSDAIAQWAGIQRYLGRSDAQSHKRFYLTAGMSVLEALDGTRKRAEFDQLAEMVEGWCDAFRERNSTANAA